MRNFLILFHGKEGSSALVKLLQNLPQIAIVKLAGTEVGLEPFDSQHCGRMPNRSVRKCLDLIYSPEPVSIDALNRIYLQTAEEPIDTFDNRLVVGMKMRYGCRSDAPGSTVLKRMPFLNRRLYTWVDHWHGCHYERCVFDILRKHSVVVFMMVRQDVFRWALSRYHGDGTGNRGNLQFKLAERTISREEIGKIEVCPDELLKCIDECCGQLCDKLETMAKLRDAGIHVTPIMYESFCEDKQEFVRLLLNEIAVECDDQMIAGAIEAGCYFEKIHSDDIATFVENHQEIEARFGRCRVDFMEMWEAVQRGGRRRGIADVFPDLAEELSFEAPA